MNRCLPLTTTILIVITMLLGTRSSRLASAQETSLRVLTEDEVLTNTGLPVDDLGESVSISGNTVLIGAPDDENISEHGGSAFFFERDRITGDWQQTKRVSGGVEDLLGTAVAVSGDTAIISVPGLQEFADNPPRGSVRIYERDSDGEWLRKATISSPIEGSGFGDHVAISADIAVVGQDRAYVIEKNPATGRWSQTAALEPSNPEVIFDGGPVALSGQSIFVRARENTPGGETVNSILIFEKDLSTGEWVETAELMPSDAATGGNFLFAVATSPDLALFGGSKVVNAAGETMGVVYVFEKELSSGEWIETAKLATSDTTGRAGFGSRVALSGNTALISSFSADPAGAVYVFKRETPGNWVETAKLIPSDIEGTRSFGLAVDLSGNTALVRHVSTRDGGIRGTGSVYVFNLEIAGIFRVDSTVDEVDVDPGDGQCETASTGDCTLRAAIQEANAQPGLNKIIIPEGTYRLTLGGVGEDEGASGDLDITDDVIIIGTNSFPTVIDGDGIDRVMHILGASEDSVVNVTLEKITIRNGAADAGDGGSILNAGGNLEVIHTTIADNHARRGGGIFNQAPNTMSVRNSAILDNTAEKGAAIYDEGIGLSIANTTISGNVATSEGSINSRGLNLMITNSTIYANTGGGISLADDGEAKLQNTIFANNGTPCIGNGAAPSKLKSIGNNIIDDPDDAAGCDIVLVSSDLVGEPGLMEFVDNGTSGNGHFSLAANSPAIDAGNNDGCSVSDQVGNFRFNGNGDGNIICDIGSVEFPDALTSPATQRSEDQKVEFTTNTDFFPALAIYQNTAVFGASLNEFRSFDGGGTAIIFDKNTSGNWVETTRLKDPEVERNDQFGRSAAISGGTLFVGVPNDDTDAGVDSGSVIIFQKNELTGDWSLLKKLTPADADADDLFGSSVSISGNTALIGAPGKQHGDSDSVGGAYLFVRDTSGNWGEKAKLVPSESESRNFGLVVSLSENTAVVRSREASRFQSRNGRVFFFEKSMDDTWNETAMVKGTDVGGSDVFGSSLSIFENTLLIGDPEFRVSTGERIGAAFVYKKDNVGNWIQGEILNSPPDTTTGGDNFGSSVSLFGNVALVGANRRGDSRGIAYLFGKATSGGWIHRETLLPSVNANLFGGSVALSQGGALVSGISSPIFAYNLESDTDDQAPVITLVGEASETVIIGEVYNDAGAMALDDIDGEITDRVVVAGLPIDTSVAGVHKVTYTVSDQLGNEAEPAIRTVIVVPESDDTASIIVKIVDLITLVESVSLFVPDSDLAELIAPLEEAVIKLGIMDATGDIEAFELLNTFIQGTIDLDFGLIEETDAIELRRDAKQIQVAIRGADFIPVTEIQKLVASEAGNDDRIGAQVASADDVVLISARSRRSVFVFEKELATDRWTERSQLRPSEPAEASVFGLSVAISGTTAVIGDPRADNAEGVQSGAAYVFERDGSNNWTEMAKLLAADGTEFDFFGSRVAIYKNTILVVAVGDDVGSRPDIGSAYIFEKDATTQEWVETAKLTGSDPDELEDWGVVADLGDGIAVIGAPLSNGELGRADIFEKDSSTGIWGQTAKLLPETIFVVGSRFGFSASISDKTVVVGTIETLPVAFVFQKDTSIDEWVQTDRLTVYDEAGDTNNFIHGFDDIVLSGNTLLGSTSIHFETDGERLSTRAVYVFQRNALTGAWSPIKRLMPSAIDLNNPFSVPMNSGFGNSLSISNGFVFASDTLDGDAGVRAGAVYVFDIRDMVEPEEEILTFIPVADATIKEDFPTENFGAIREVETDNRPVQHFMMKFDISGIGDREVTSAKLQLQCMDKSNRGGNFHETDPDWFEDTVTWNNAPEPDPDPVASLGPVSRRTRVELDLSSVITHDGIYSFRVISPSRDGADYRTKEKRNREPELILTLK